MKRIACLLVATFLCLCAFNANACTSFAVYTSAPIYGLNWDFPETAAYLRLNNVEAYHKVFSIGFDTQYGMATNGSMNDQGFAAFVQDQYPKEMPTLSMDDTTAEDMHDYASWTPYLFAKVQEVRDMFDAGAYVGNRYDTFHDLFADAHGNALVLEEYEGQNMVTPVEEGVLVMANFPNCLISRVDFTQRAEQLWYRHGFVGVDRYKAVQEMIVAHHEEFDVMRGFEALEKAAQHGYYRTRFSGVYDPISLAVYVVIERDFGHIWKISILEETIETFSGFGENRVFSFAEFCDDDMGIPFEKLTAYANERR